jgi:hypothetical protein
MLLQIEGVSDLRRLSDELPDGTRQLVWSVKREERVTVGDLDQPRVWE